MTIYDVAGNKKRMAFSILCWKKPAGSGAIY